MRISWWKSSYWFKIQEYKLNAKYSSTITKYIKEEKECPLINKNIKLHSLSIVNTSKLSKFDKWGKTMRIQKLIKIYGTPT